MFVSTGVTGIGNGFMSSCSKINDVTEMFWNATQISGAVPELWNIGGLVGTKCYNGLSSTKVTNWDNIPANWK